MATDAGGLLGAYSSCDSGSSRKTPQNVSSQAMVSGLETIGSTPRAHAIISPAPCVLAASRSEGWSCDTAPTSTLALVGKLDAVYAMTSKVAVWYRLMPSLDHSGRLNAKMYPAPNTTLGSATAASSMKSSALDDFCRRCASSHAAMKPPTTVTDAETTP